MPKYRQLHTKIIDSFDFNEMPDDFTRVTWMLLPLIVDSEGRGIDNMAWVRSKLYPLRDDVETAQLAAAFAWFDGRGMIVRYEVEGKRYFCIPKFKTYQSGTEKEAKSTLPPPPDNSGATPAQLPTNSGATPPQYNADTTNANGENDDDHPPAYDGLSRAFTDATNIPPYTGGPAKFYAALEKMSKAGVLPEDVSKAVITLRERDYTIVNIGSVVNTAINEMSRRTKPPNGNLNGKPKRNGGKSNLLAGQY